MFLLSLFNIILAVCLVVLIVKVSTIEKYLKCNQDHIKDLYQIEIDRLTNVVVFDSNGKDKEK